MLEDLIEKAVDAQAIISQLVDSENSEDWGKFNRATDHLFSLQTKIGAFVLAHADTFIAWEREHALRTSPFEE